ncbi:hypothetical protein Ancab_011343 [Ancistrocladus abbreviatus]
MLHNRLNRAEAYDHLVVNGIIPSYDKIFGYQDPIMVSIPKNSSPVEHETHKGDSMFQMLQDVFGLIEEHVDMDIDRRRHIEGNEEGSFEQCVEGYSLEEKGDLSLNRLSGSIPPNKLSDDMTTMLLADNSLNGSVPSSIWQSRKLNATEQLILLQGNPLCSNSRNVHLCGSLREDDGDSQDMLNSTTLCLQACPSPYEKSPTSPKCFCAFVPSLPLQQPAVHPPRPPGHLQRPTQTTRKRGHTTKDHGTKGNTPRVEEAMYHVSLEDLFRPHDVDGDGKGQD